MVGPWPWTFGGFLWGVSVFLSRWLLRKQQQHGSQRLSTRPQSLLTCVNGILEYLPPSVARWPRSWHSRELHGGRDRGILAWQPNQFAPAAVGCPVCSTSQGQTPTWCDLWRCREMITKLHFERVRRDIPGPTPITNWKRGVSETSRAAAAPKFLHDGHHTPELATTGRHFYAQ